MNVNNSFVDSVDEYIIKKVEKEKKKNCSQIQGKLLQVLANQFCSSDESQVKQTEIGLIKAQMELYQI